MKKPVAGVAFSAETSAICCGGSGGFEIWDTATWSPRFIAAHTVPHLFGLAFDPVGRWIYVSDYRAGMRLLCANDGGEQPLPGSPHNHHVPSFAVAPSGQALLLTRGGAGCNRVEYWNVDRGGTFSPRWALRDGQRIEPAEPFLLNQSTWFTGAVAISDDEMCVATAESRVRLSWLSFLALRDARTGDLLNELGPTECSGHVEMRLGSSGVLYVWDGPTLERWDLPGGRLTHRSKAPGRSYIRGLVIDPSEHLLITASGDGAVRVWDAATLTVADRVRCGIGKLHSLALHPDGNILAAGGEQGQTILLQVDLNSDFRFGGAPLWSGVS